MQAGGRKPKKVTYDHYGYFFIAPFFIVFLIFFLGGLVSLDIFFIH